MQSIINKLENRLPKIYATEAIAVADKLVQIKLDSVQSGNSWYLVEGERMENDFLFWGLVKNRDGHSEQFFTLNDLASSVMSDGSKIEEDLSFKPKKLSLLR